MATNSTLKGSGNDQKSKLKKSPILTGKLIFFEIGWKNEMLAPLQVKLNKTEERVSTN